MPSLPASEILPWHRQLWDVLAASPRLGHALLLAGPPGVGKTRFAAALGQRLLCAAGTACGRCHSCRLLAADNHPDLARCGPVAGKTEIPIDDVRELTAFLTLASHLGHGRVVIIEEAERLSRAAANALLKSLEEPPAGTHLLLISHAPGRLLPTVRSRCQRVDFPVPAREDGLAYLQRAGCAHPAAALTLAGGAPLRAAALTAADLQIGEGLLKALEEVRCGHLDALAAAEEWHKIDGDKAFANLAGLLAHAVQDTMTASSRDTADPQVQRLHKLVIGLDLRQIFCFWDKILDDRGLLDAPLDRRLVWDEVFLTWQRMSSQTT
ncbi:MAG: DNA polymerase III subunit delta' [Gammaproteobacteria bacterium]|nr:DNA polymerase III subunit delta' [Gammaproteobacteria bacterium]